MIHPSHNLAAYTGDVKKPMTFCKNCGKEEDEGLTEPCSNKFYAEGVDKDKEQK